jgi:hypothetical protein
MDTMSKNKMTVMEAHQVADKCERLFRRAALAWVRGNNSYNSLELARGEALCAKHRRAAEALLKPLGIVCNYPGLYPVFTTQSGVPEYGCLAAISRAVAEHGRKAVAA